MFDATTYSPAKFASVQRNSSSASALASSTAPRSANSTRSVFVVITPLTSSVHSSRERSSQIRLVCSYCPGGETLAVLSLFHEVAHDPLDVLAKLAGDHLVLPQLASEAAVEPKAAAEMYLEALDRAVAVVDHLSLEADVRDLDACARVRAPVDID